jgi:hypothetical protein
MGICFLQFLNDKGTAFISMDLDGHLRITRQGRAGKSGRQNNSTIMPSATRCHFNWSTTFLPGRKPTNLSWRGRRSASDSDRLNRVLVSLIDRFQRQMLVDLQALFAFMPGNELDLSVREAFGRQEGQHLMAEQMRVQLLLSGRGSKVGVEGRRRLNPDDEFRCRHPGCPIRRPAYRHFVTAIAADPHL